VGGGVDIATSAVFSIHVSILFNLYHMGIGDFNTCTVGLPTKLYFQG
jgi:hypothetical protein